METEVIATTKLHKHGPQRLKSSLSGPLRKKLFETWSLGIVTEEGYYS